MKTILSIFSGARNPDCTRSITMKNQSAQCTHINKPTLGSHTSGVLTCRTSYHPTTQFETGVFVGGSQKSEIESILSIELGKGTRPSSATSFDAREVRDNLQPKTEE